MSVHENDNDAAPHVAVVGASHAAVQLADRLRADGFTGLLTLISDEIDPPYQRPPLSKAWLKGEATTESLLLRSAGYYADNGVELLLGTTVEQAVREGDGVVLRLAGPGGTPTARRFDRLVLATGARARRLRIPGASHRDVLVLREIGDARRIVDRVGHGPVVVIGGGFIGLEVAATLRGLGVDVAVVEAGGQLMGRAVGAETAEFLLAAHRRMGVDVVLGATPEEIVVENDRIRAVRLAAGRVLPAATVVVGVGAEPRTELAEQLGIVCERGVLVDEYCRTSDGRTLAIGDCTVHVTPDGQRIRLESVDNAVEQAHAAAVTLLDRPLPVRPEPWFWSDQGPWKLQIVGRVDGHTDVLVRTDPAKPQRLVVLYFADDALIAAECVNAPADFVAVRTAFARGVRPSRDMLAASDIPLRTLLTPARTG